MHALYPSLIFLSFFSLEEYVGHSNGPFMLAMTEKKDRHALYVYPYFK